MRVQDDDGGVGYRGNPVGSITYPSRRGGGNEDIYVAEYPSGDEFRLSSHPARDLYPTISPDGSKVAFVSLRDGKQQIYLFEFDKGGRLPLEESTSTGIISGTLSKLSWEGTEDSQPSWCGNDSLAFASLRSGWSDIYLMDSSSSTNDVVQTVVEHVGEHNTSLECSSGGEWVVYGRPPANAWSASVDSTEPTDMFAFTGQGEASTFAWSPDDDVILFNCRPSSDADICITEVDSHWIFSSPVTCVASDFNDSHASFSPLGDQFAFTSDRTGEFRVYVTDYPYGGTITLFSSGPVKDGEPEWGGSPSVKVNNVAPTVTVSGPTVIDEGSSGFYSASFTDPGTMDTHSVAWDCDGDGFDDGVGTTTLCGFIDGHDTVTVRARVTDDDTGVGIGTLLVTVNNVAPTVAADNASVTVNEGDPVNNTGTFGDVGDDDVTITASTGDITQGSSTWAWSFASTDGPDESQIITITATDSDGATSTAMFNLTVNNVAPTPTLEAPLTANRNEIFSLDAFWFDPARSLDNGYLVEFDTDANGSLETAFPGSPYGTGVSVTTSIAIEGFYTFNLAVTDKDGGVGTSSVTVEIINQAPVCDLAESSVGEIWPPNHQMVGINVLGVTDLEGDTISITISSIFQDEFVNGKGDGNFGPDGAGIGTDTAEVRAERTGNKKTPGDGRVYHIAFTATDGHGGSCNGEVLVGVPHSQGKNGNPAVDGGALYDSTIE